MKIIEQYKDMAGKYRTMIDIGNGETIMLKFQQMTNNEIILQEARKVIRTRLKAEDLKIKLAEVNNQIAALIVTKTELTAKIALSKVGEKINGSGYSR